jgi:hypothetical protein
MPAVSFGAPTAAGVKAGLTATGAPLRTAFVYFPNGVVQDTWWPQGMGKNFELNKTMEPLQSVKEHIQVLGGMDHQHATGGPDGPGDHARANATFLTGVRVKKTAGADIRANVSIDQLVAKQLGHLTRFPSLELTCDSVRKSGNCDSGYSCAYQYNMAWSSPSTPVAPEANPRLVFERMFGAGSPGQRASNLKLRQQQQQSLLDFVLEDARSIQKKLSPNDKRKLDQYLTSVRAVEERISKAENMKDAPDPAVETPAGIPASFSDHAQIMFDMLLLAFQTDSTRVATLLLAADGANRPFPEIGIAEGHHNLSHHGGKKDWIEKITKIDRFYMDQFAVFLKKMADEKDVDGNSLLHNSMIIYGGGIGDGNRHNHDNLPVILAGHGGGTLEPGRFNKLRSQPMTNLYLSMTDRLGLKVDTFGDSTGRVESL